MSARVDRNIYRVPCGFNVLVTRRCNPFPIYGGTFKRLVQARAARLGIESKLPPLRPWGYKGNTGRPRRTQEQLRKERTAAGLCYLCGDEPPISGMRGCRSCYSINAAKRREARAAGRLLT